MKNILNAKVNAKRQVIRSKEEEMKQSGGQNQWGKMGVQYGAANIMTIDTK